MYSLIIVQAVRKEYAHFTEDKQIMQAVVFERNEVELDLSFPSPTYDKGWKIQPLTYPKVSINLRKKLAKKLLQILALQS